MDRMTNVELEVGRNRREQQEDHTTIVSSLKRTDDLISQLEADAVKTNLSCELYDIKLNTSQGEIMKLINENNKNLM